MAGSSTGDSGNYEPIDLPPTHLTPAQLKRREKQRKGRQGASPPPPRRDVSESPRTARGGSARVLAVLGVVAAALVVIATVGVADGMGIRGYQELREQQETEQARRTAPAAADRAAAAILAYDYRTLEADRDAAARFMTEEYRAKYEKTFGLVLENAPELEAVVTADVKASGVVHADPDRVNVLLFVNQRTVSTANNGEPQLALNRVVFAMEQQGGTWLVDDIIAY